MNLPSPRFRIAPLPKELSHVRGFNSLQTFFPTLSKLYRLNRRQSEGVWLDSKWRIVGLDISGTSGPCSLSLVPNVDISGEESTQDETRVHPAYLKVTHLLDPIRWMKGKYSLPKHTGLPWHSKTWASAWTKLQDSWNQAYVETVASYALGRLRDEGISPHFNEFYGAFCARADIYRYNLTEEFGSYRNERWFWQGQKNGLYKMHIMNKAAPEEVVSDDVIQELMREPSVIDSESSHDTESIISASSASEKSVTETLPVDEEEIEIIGGEDLVDVGSLHSDQMTDVSFAEKSHMSKSSKSSSVETEEGDEPDDTHAIYSELRDFPVMLIAIEQNSGTMDYLLDNVEEVGATHGTPEWEMRWSAWIFQVVAALSVAQAVFGFTHNDLHTNNVVWTPTTRDYIYYTLGSGATFKVPTFGKLFRVIDFGRAIFTINGTQFISDDFRPGNDADGQYCFKPLHPRPPVEIPPNPSFDLSRFAVSLFESIFPEKPEDKEGGGILSSEDDFVMKETVSPLFNCMWTWMVDDNGENILVEPDGDERFPDFDLYKHIAEKIHNAIPSEQFKHPAFDRFQVNPSEVDTTAKKWSLFA